MVRDEGGPIGKSISSQIYHIARVPDCLTPALLGPLPGFAPQPPSDQQRRKYLRATVCRANCNMDRPPGTSVALSALVSVS
jgi:hypothetical protein